MPDVLLTGRFWAEEGPIFFARAATSPAWVALWMPYAGYLNLPANAATVLAWWLVPMAYSPYVTMAVGLFSQLYVFGLLFAARDAWLGSRWIRLVAGLLVLTIPGSEELLLTSLGTQFFLLLSCGIILCLRPERGWREAYRCGALLLAPLSGLGPAGLLPLFVAKAVQERSRRRAGETLILAAACTLQLVLFASRVGTRSYLTDPGVLLATVAVRHLAVPFGGMNLARDWAGAVQATLSAGRTPWAAIAAVLLMAALVTWSALRLGTRQAAIWLFAAGAMLAGVAYFGAQNTGYWLVDPDWGPRYAYAAQGMFALTLLNLAVVTRTRARWAWAGLCVWLLTVGMAGYPSPPPLYAHGPAWRRAVHAWTGRLADGIPTWPRPWYVWLVPPASTVTR